MLIEDRLAKLIKCARYGRLEMRLRSAGCNYIVTYLELLNCNLRDILVNLEDGNFSYDDEII